MVRAIKYNVDFEVIELPNISCPTCPGTKVLNIDDHSAVILDEPIEIDLTHLNNTDLSYSDRIIEALKIIQNFNEKSKAIALATKPIGHKGKLTLKRIV